MTKITIAGLRIDPLTKAELLTAIERRLELGEKLFITTPYSEFLYHALSKHGVMDMLNKASIAVPDGVGILWAATFLDKPFLSKNFYLKIFESFWHIVTTGAAIVLHPRSVRRIVPEKIVGADLIWDLSRLAGQKDYSIFLFGAQGNTAEVVADKLRQKFPNIRIIGTSNKALGDKSVASDIVRAKPDMLFVALAALRQEQWIAQHIQELPIKLVIGLGGTFDYIAGNVLRPPKFIRSIGLEWLYRLITQPKRAQRIWNGTIGLITVVLRYKVFTSQTFRQNVVCAVFNRENNILVCKRNPDKHVQNITKFGRAKTDTIFDSYWQLPQGGMEVGESIEAAAVRELEEETGITDAKLIMVSEHTHTYEWLNGNRPLFGNPSHKRGQEQHVVYFKYHGPLDNIQIDKKEFVDFKWVPVSELLQTLHPERRPLGGIVQNDFSLIKNLLL